MSGMLADLFITKLMNTATKKRLIILFKTVVLIASYSFIAYRLFYDESLKNLFFKGALASGFNGWLIAAIVLMPVNWGIEAIKWSLLMRPTEKIQFIKAFKGILAGITISIFTPNRIGEYVGRIWVLRQRNRLSGIAVTIAGSLAQSSITFITATLAGFFWITGNYASSITNIKQLFFAGVITFSGILIYFLLPRITRKLNKRFINKIIDNSLLGIRKLNTKILGKALAFSAIRYGTFVLQFICLLNYFQTDISFYESLIGIAMLYGAMLVIPTIAVAEPGVRSTLSLLIFGIFSTNEAGILAASLTLWIINLAVPALTGALILTMLKIEKL